MIAPDMCSEFVMTRARVLPLRLLVTVGLLLLVYGLLRLLWYPGGYFELFGVPKLFWTLAIGVLIVGPGLSTLVYRPGKPGLLFDLVVIAALEAGIFGWALLELHARQPVFAVFAVDRFEAVRRDEVDLQRLAYAPLAQRPGHTPRLVYAELPTDIDAMNSLIDETVFLGMADIDRRPEFWRPYPQGVSQLRRAAQPLTALLADEGERAARLQRWLDRRSLDPAQLSYLPIKGRRADGTVILHADIGYPVAVLAINPW
jgi:hypothetical protein